MIRCKCMPILSAQGTINSYASKCPLKGMFFVTHFNWGITVRKGIPRMDVRLTCYASATVVGFQVLSTSFN